MADIMVVLVAKGFLSPVGAAFIPAIVDVSLN
jgi:hypothetical protein